MFLTRWSLAFLTKGKKTQPQANPLHTMMHEFEEI